MVCKGRARLEAEVKAVADRGSNAKARLAAMGNMGSERNGDCTARFWILDFGICFGVPLRSSDHGKEGLEAGQPRYLPGRARAWRSPL